MHKCRWMKTETFLLSKNTFQLLMTIMAMMMIVVVIKIKK